MNAGQILKASEASALRGDEFLSHVTGKTTKKSKKKGSFLATGFITGMIVLFLGVFSSANLIPSALSERLIEETDIQYADAVESKKIVFAQALQSGELPEDTVRILKSNGVLVGYYDGDNFIETNKHDGGLLISINNKIITPDNFVAEVSTDVRLYDAFNKATYARAAYYYDESARKVFRRIGTNRNNYTENSNFDEVMDKLIGSGSNVNINSVSLAKKTRINEKTGKEEIYYEYEENGTTANSKSEVTNFIEQVKNKNYAASEVEASLYSADALKVADTISKEQRSSLFYLAFMENISKMKAGEGNSSKINEAMNYLYQDVETEVVDIKTGEIIKTSGTALESPSLYAILSGEKINPDKVENYSSDRVLKVVENKLNKTDSSIISNTVTSTSNNIAGSIGRFIENRVAAPTDAVNAVSPIIDSSLINNSYKTIRGVNAGEFLVEGAINVGKELAKESGATAGDAAAISNYARLNNTILAMDAKVDRNNRSPFDITSKNTFLGAIVYKTATILAKTDHGIWSGIKSFGSLLSQSVLSLLPSSYADETTGYLSSYGDCQTLSSVNAVGSVQCSEIATFDTSTLDDPFHDDNFIDFINNNTTLNSSGVRTINRNSKLAEFILYNDERTTPIGVTDGGIIDSLTSNSSSIYFVTNILSMIKNYLGTNESEKRIASGAAFVNTAMNSDWQTYKYAQRYVSLARATAALRQYAGESTAYNKIEFFEGNENPVVAFLQNYYAMK